MVVRKESPATALMSYSTRAIVHLAKLTSATFLALSLTQVAPAETRRVIPNGSHCKSLSSPQKAWLAEEWKPFLRFTRACTIRNAKRQPVVILISVWAELYYKAQPGKTVVQTNMPQAQIFSASGEALGKLPYNFPDDPPAKLTVTFTKWANGFPEKIELFLTDPRAGGNRPLTPLLWSHEERKYLPEREEHHEPSRK